MLLYVHLRIKRNHETKAAISIPVLTADRWASLRQGRRRGWKNGRVQVVVNYYFATKYWAGSMLESDSKQLYTVRTRAVAACIATSVHARVTFVCINVGVECQSARADDEALVSHIWRTRARALRFMFELRPSPMSVPEIRGLCPKAKPGVKSRHHQSPWRRHGVMGVRIPPFLFRPLLGLPQIRWKVVLHIRGVSHVCIL